ncbi:hypothetical protein FACS189490_11340 [Clostridia bacterium]|nr:hypothetical protein FACS189490_11340 [Clostridia bacterium]
MGNLMVVTGGMYAGKTEWLYNLVRDFDKREYRYLILTPGINRGRGKDEVIQRDKNYKYTLLDTIANYDDGTKVDFSKINYLIIDEGNFYEGSRVSHTIQKLLLTTDLEIIVSGLQINRFGKPYNSFMTWCLHNADKILVLHSKCDICGSPGFSSVIVGDDSGELNVVETGEVKYIPVCRKCHAKLNKKGAKS